MTTQKHAGGRPTKLTPELLKKAQDYLTQNDALGAAALLPTVERLSLILDISRETVYDWSSKKSGLYLQFSDIVSRLKASQADKLIQNGLVGRYSGPITKLMLAKHGYVEKQELTGAEGAPLMPIGLDSAVLARMQHGSTTQSTKNNSPKSS